jgi:hypothetical protein
MAMLLRDKFHCALECLRFLRIQRITGFQISAAPRFDPETDRWFRNRLAQAQLYLEFGCGGSTRVADELEIKTIGIESDRFYAASLRRVLRHPEAIEIITPRMGVTVQWGMPLFRARAKGFRYVTAPFDRLGSRFPDFVLIDGRYRIACLLETARRAAKAGASATVLMDDYATRAHYHVVEQLLGAPHIIGRSAAFEVGKADVSTEVVQQFMRDPI